MTIRQWLARLYCNGWSQWPDAWKNWLTSSQLTTIFTPNPEQLVLAHRRPAFANLLAAATILLPDGIGLLWADWWYNRRSSFSRLTGTDVLKWWLTNPLAKQERTLLIGGRDGVAAALAVQRDPTGQWCRGTEGMTNIKQWSAQVASAEEEKLQKLIMAWRPTVVMVAFGAPYQEEWVQHHSDFLNQAGIKIVMVCGGALDYLSGRIVRAPARWRALGLEWLYRLYHEPWRWRRQLRLGQFIWLVITNQ